MALHPSSPPPDAVQFLATVSVFSGLDAGLIKGLLGQITWVSLRGGDPLFRRDDPGDAMYLVVSGRLRVVKRDDMGQVHVLREVGRGESVGEMALLTGEARTATVVAVRDTELAALSREAFDRLLASEPRAVVGVTRMLAGWLARSGDLRPAGAPNTIAIVPLGQAGGLPDFVARLARLLSSHGPTLHLSAGRVDGLLGEGTAQALEGTSAYARATRWLNDQEGLARFVFYEADPTPTPWTARCLGQADRVLRVADAHDTPDPGPVRPSRTHPRAAGSSVFEELVLLHPQGTTPSGTARWLRLGTFAAHHHLRAGDDADVERLARHLAGKAVGLVLGGGGARGFAHIGVIRALIEAGIPIDRVGGASMGAVIGAQYASGLSPDEMLELNRHGWLKFKPHRRYTLPLISLLSEAAGDRMVQMMFGDRQIEDLWVNYFCVSTNLSRAELVVHREGPVGRWVRASASIPGSAPPIVADGGDLLVDGGALDNVPVGAMREMGEGPIIAVDVSPTVDLVVDQNLRKAPTPWEMIFGRFRRGRRRPVFPSLFQILYRTALLSSIRAARRGLDRVSLYLEPPTSGFEIFDMEAMERIAEVGYRYAAEKVREWRPG